MIRILNLELRKLRKQLNYCDPDFEMGLIHEIQRIEDEIEQIKCEKESCE